MIVLDIYRAWQDNAVLLNERDKAVKESAEWHAQAIEERGKKERLHAELAEARRTIDAAAAANVALEARLAASDPTYDHVREQRWRAWNERLVTSLNDENDLLGRRILALEAWVALNKGDRDTIYVAAGLPRIIDAAPHIVVSEDTEGAA